MKSAIVCVFVMAAVMLASAANGPADGPRVCIKNLVNGLKFPIHVNVKGTVRDMKETIEQVTKGKLPVSEQELKHEGESLEDHKTLEHYHIGYHSDLELVYHTKEDSDKDEVYFVPIPAARNSTPDGPKPATIYLATPGTINFSLDVDLTDTVLTVKQKIYKQEEYKVENQQLFYQSWVFPMNDTRTLEDYRVTDGVQLVLRVPGNQWCNIDY